MGAGGVCPNNASKRLLGRYDCAGVKKTPPRGVYCMGGAFSERRFRGFCPPPERYENIKKSTHLSHAHSNSFAWLSFRFSTGDTAVEVAEVWDCRWFAHEIGCGHVQQCRGNWKRYDRGDKSILIVNGEFASFDIIWAVPYLVISKRANHHRVHINTSCYTRHNPTACWHGNCSSGWVTIIFQQNV